MQLFVSTQPAQNPLVATLARKMAEIKEIPDDKREALRGEAEKIVKDQVYPAWQQAIALLQAQSPRTTNDAGLWSLKGGLQAYAYDFTVTPQPT